MNLSTKIKNSLENYENKKIETNLRLINEIKQFLNSNEKEKKLNKRTTYVVDLLESMGALVIHEPKLFIKMRYIVIFDGNSFIVKQPFAGSPYLSSLIIKDN